MLKNVCGEDSTNGTPLEQKTLASGLRLREIRRFHAPPTQRTPMETVAGNPVAIAVLGSYTLHDQ
jgi:hypothetical protein